MYYGLAIATGDRKWQPTERRVPVFLVVLAMHIGLILLLVLSRQIVHPLKKQGSLSVFSLAAAPSAPPVPVTIPIVPTETDPVIASPAIVFAEQQGAEGDPDGEVCSPVDIVTAQLANDPIVPDAIDRVPREERSISEAIVVWNATWSTSAADEDAPLGGLRSRIMATLATLPPDCLAMPVVGPRLIPIAHEGGTTTFLAFGSGEWSWQQLVEPPELLASTENNSWTWEELFADYVPPTSF